MLQQQYKMRKTSKHLSASHFPLSKNISSPQPKQYIRSPDQRSSLKNILVDLHFQKSQRRKQPSELYQATKIVQSPSSSTHITQSMIKDSYMEQKFAAVTSENQKLLKQRQSLFVKNCELEKMISALRNNKQDPEVGEALEDQCETPWSQQNPTLSTAKLTVIKCLERKKQRNQRKNQSVCWDRLQKRKNQDFLDINFNSPKQANNFDRELEQLRRKKLKLLSDLNETRSQNHKHKKTSDEEEYFINLPHNFESEQSPQTSLLSSMKTTQFIPDSASRSNCYKKQGQKYVLIQCCDCENCSSDHIPDIKNLEFEGQTIFHKDQTINPESHNLLQVPGQETNLKKTRKSSDCYKDLSTKKYLSPSLKALHPYAKSPNKTIVSDLSQKINQLRAENSKLRGEFY